MVWPGYESKGQSVIVSDIASAGRRVVVGLAGWLAGQERSLANARRASTEVSRRRIERDEVSIYLDELHGAAGDGSAAEWPSTTAQAAD